MDKQKIGDFIRFKRKEKELTQIELAEKLGVSDRAVSKWERGICCPDISILKDLCKILDVNINELLSGSELIELSKDESEKILVETVKEYTDAYKKKNQAMLTFTIIILGLYVLLVVAMYLNFNQINKRDGLNFEVIRTRIIGNKLFKALENYNYDEIRKIETKYTDLEAYEVDIHDDEEKCMEYLEEDKDVYWAFACRLKNFENNKIKFKSHKVKNYTYNYGGSYSVMFEVIINYKDIDTKIYVYLSTHNGVINNISSSMPLPNDEEISELKEAGYDNIYNKIGYFFNVMYEDRYLETVDINNN